MPDHKEHTHDHFHFFLWGFMVFVLLTLPALRARLEKLEERLPSRPADVEVQTEVKPC